MDLGLLQREVAKQIGVAKDTYRFWECNTTYPRPRQWPGIIRYLGYDPVPAGDSLAEKARAARRVRGL